MKKVSTIIVLLLLLTGTIPVRGQYYSVNFDKETVAKMVASFNTEAATEMYYADQIAKIREHYQAAEVAAAGIFTSKFLDRKALTDLGLWTSPQGIDRPWTLDKQHRELLLSTYLSHGFG